VGGGPPLIFAILLLLEGFYLLNLGRKRSGREGGSSTPPDPPLPTYGVYRILHRLRLDCLVLVGLLARLAAEQSEEAGAKATQQSANDHEGHVDPLPDDEGGGKVVDDAGAVVGAGLRLGLDLVPDVEDPDGADNEPGDDQGQGDEIKEGCGGKLADGVDGVAAGIVLTALAQLAATFLEEESKNEKDEHQDAGDNQVVGDPGLDAAIGRDLVWLGDIAELDVFGVDVEAANDDGGDAHANHHQAEQGESAALFLIVIHP